MKIKGYISKKVIMHWLENYESLVVGDRSFDAVPGNSGPKDVDGVSLSQLNKIMLESAVDKLPLLERFCCKNRWYFKHAVRYTTNKLGITSKEYYSLCNSAIELIHKDLNGEMVGVKKLMSLLKE